MDRQFNRDNLYAGYVVEFRNGERRLVTRVGATIRILLNPDTHSWSTIGAWDFDTLDRIKCVDEDSSELDIVRVYGWVENPDHWHNAFCCNVEQRNLLWEREVPTKKLTVNQISELLGYRVEVVGDEA